MGCSSSIVLLPPLRSLLLPFLLSVLSLIQWLWSVLLIGIPKFTKPMHWEVLEPRPLEPFRGQLMLPPLVSVTCPTPVAHPYPPTWMGDLHELWSCCGWISVKIHWVLMRSIISRVYDHCTYSIYLHFQKYNVYLCSEKSCTQQKSSLVHEYSQHP